MISSVISSFSSLLPLLLVRKNARKINVCKKLFKTNTQANFIVLRDCLDLENKCITNFLYLCVHTGFDKIDYNTD